ncbi:acyl-CoA synthetase (AMP-forming)/AMP-acid ligase II [Bradyrhizobium ottawaense]|uniref:AMP-binding protein n=1 Tax=Bradyrhizobium ottawaense TaxID=931866 RepID=UPI0038346F28
MVRVAPAIFEQWLIETIEGLAAPLCHMNALGSCKFALAAGANLVLMAQFDAKQFISAIGKYSVTWITSVPTMMAMVVREPEALAAIDRSKVHYVRMGSAPANQRLYDAVHKAFSSAAIAGGYGTTEAGPVVFGPTKERPLPGGDALGWPQTGGFGVHRQTKGAATDMFYLTPLRHISTLP